MLTDKTKTAIAILREIAYHSTQPCPDGGSAAILKQLQDAGLIRLLSGHKPEYTQSYELCMKLSELSLYRLLIAIGEGVNLIASPLDEDRIYKYHHYGTAASKLGVVNQMLRTLLSDVNILEL